MTDFVNDLGAPEESLKLNLAVGLVGDLEDDVAAGCASIAIASNFLFLLTPLLF